MKAPKGIETFQNAMFPDCRRFIHLGECETSAFWILGELITIRTFKESELEKLLLPFICIFLHCVSSTWTDQDIMIVT